MIVIRDAGGVGDIVRIFAIIDGLASRGHRIDWLVPQTYVDLCRACPSVADGRCVTHGISVPKRRRRSSLGQVIRQWGQTKAFPYMRVLEAADDAPVIDLFCPALRHEVGTLGRPTMDRVKSWALAAGIWPLDANPVRLVPGDDAEAEAAAWWADRTDLSPCRCIAISPASVRGLRTWRNSTRRRRSVRVGQVGGLSTMLRGMGWQTVIFDHDPAALELPASAHSIDPRHRVQAARLRRCAGYIGPDSGFLHVAAAMDMRCVGIFGPTNPRMVLAPYRGDRVLGISGVWNDRVRREVGCVAPCYGFLSGGFNPKACAGKCRVLESVSEDRIAQLADRHFRASSTSLIVRS